MKGDLVRPRFGPLTSPQSPRSESEPESEPMPTYEMILNNQPIEIPRHLVRDVDKALDTLRLDPEKAKTLGKELLLRPDILIGLINETKVFLQQSCPRLFDDKYHGNDRLEQDFINNKNLLPDEKKLVEETIADYKQMVKSMVSKNTPRPITPPPSIDSFLPALECSCNIM